MLREWAAATFSAPTDYWTFRKMLTLQLSLASFAEYVLHLTRLNPDMMYVHQDSGLLNVSYYKFDVDDATGMLIFDFFSMIGVVRIRFLVNKYSVEFQLKILG